MEQENSFICTDLNSDSESDNESLASFVTAIAWRSEPIKSSPLQPHELSWLSEKLKRIVVIQQTDRAYHLALSDIGRQSLISLVVEPSFYGRHCNTSVLVIATTNNAYVFDLKALGKIFVDLSKLLQAECPRKLMHYSHRICDFLWNRHQIKVAGICDTFVAWCVARRERRHVTLQHAISKTFNIPLVELNCDELNSSSESQRNFTARPLSDGQLQYLASLAILQEKLHDRLIYENICGELQQMSSKFSCEFSRNQDSADVALSMQPASRAGFDCIDPYYKIASSID